MEKSSIYSNIPDSQSGNIYVTSPYLPPLEEIIQKIRKIYERNVLTNSGPEELEFEETMRNYLKTENFFFVSNGTIAIQIALRALGITSGQIITTPFTYVATISSILWERCEPVFVDIDPHTFNIDAEKIEAAITDQTRAILPVHVFGHPCAVEKIDEIAKKHNLKVIYDAAHAFGVRKNGEPVSNWGDISTLSFHATKLFHTLEGGACITADKDIAWNISWIKRFGHGGEDHLMLGINAKQDEINAAFGNLNFSHLDEILANRRRAWELYEKMLSDSFQTRKIDPDVDYNYAYFPILFKNEQALRKAFEKLKEIRVFPRRYFYPALTKLPYITHNASCPVAEDISQRIACLPLSSVISDKTIDKICRVILCD